MPRKATYPIADLFINRWSSRAFSDKPLTDAQLMPLFEAARWAPSAYNEQPWRFVYAHAGSPLFDQLVAALAPINQPWAKNAAVLVVLLSNTILSRTGKPSSWHTLDAGSAWMSLTLQASLNGFVTHAMGDFDTQRVRTLLTIPETYRIEIVIALGLPGNKDNLSPELRARETPNDRKPLDQIVFKDSFNHA